MKFEEKTYKICILFKKKIKLEKKNINNFYKVKENIILLDF